MRGRAGALGSVLFVALVFPTACADAPPPETIYEVVGDTTFVTIPEGLDTAAIVIDDAEVLWRSDSLERPNLMTIADGTLVVGDRTRLHLLALGGAEPSPRTVGRQGQGPGEFAGVNALGTKGDTIAVLDTRNARISRLSTAGEWIGTTPLARPEEYVNPPRAGALVPFEGGWAVLFETNVRIDRGIGTALVHLTDSNAEVLQSWEGRPWVDTPGFIGPLDPFGTTDRVALGPEGVIAYGDGADYCVTVRSVADTAITRICRDRPRVPTTAAMRTVSREGLEATPEMIQRYIDLAEAQELPELVPSWDRIAIGVDGQLWVRVLGPTALPTHPTLAFNRTDMPPREQRWESYAPDGTPGPNLLLPTDFEPLVFGEGEIFGTVESELGELMVGRVRWR